MLTTIGVVQAGSVLGDTPRTLEKLKQLCEACARRRLNIAVFPEAFIGGYPKGLVFGASVGIRTDAGRDLFRAYSDCAIEVPGPVTAAIGKVAKDAALHLVIGVIEREAGTLQTYDPRRLSGVSVHREAGREFSQGDRVQFTAPSKDLQVANRELGTIEQITHSGNLEIRMDSDRELRFNIREHPHLDHGYAVTSHCSQGQTADRVLIHVDTEKSELLVNDRFAYVSVSRGQYDAQIYTNDSSELARNLSRDNSQRTATETQQQQQTAPEVEPASARSGRPAEEEQGHSCGIGIT